MLFSCTQCGTRYQLPDEQVANRVLKVRCTQCSAVLVVRDPSAQARAEVREEPAWFVAVAGQQRGPMSLDEVRTLVRDGQFGPRSYAWIAGLPQWARAADIPGLTGLFAVPPPLPDVPTPPTLPPSLEAEQAAEAARIKAAEAAEAARIQAAAEAAEAARIQAAEAAEAARIRAAAEVAEAARIRAAAEAAEAARIRAAAEVAEAARIRAAAEAAEAARIRAAAEAAEAARIRAAAEVAEAARIRAAAEAAEAARIRAAAEAAEATRIRAAAEAAEAARIQAAAEAAEAARIQAAAEAAEAARIRAAAEAAEAARIRAAAEATEAARIQAAAEAAEAARIKAAAEAAEAARMKAAADAADALQKQAEDATRKKIEDELRDQVALELARASALLHAPPIPVVPTVAALPPQSVPPLVAPVPPLPLAPTAAAPTHVHDDHAELAFFDAAHASNGDMFGQAPAGSIAPHVQGGQELSFVGKLHAKKKSKAPYIIVAAASIATAAVLVLSLGPTGATAEPGPVVEKSRVQARAVQPRPESPAKVDPPAPRVENVVGDVKPAVAAKAVESRQVVTVKPSTKPVDSTRVATADTATPTFRSMTPAEYALLTADEGKSEVKVDFDGNAAARKAEAEAAEKRKNTADELSEQVVEALGKKKSQFAKCSDDNQERVRVQFTVTASGKVTQTSVEGTTSATKSSCLMEIMGRSVFPAGVEPLTYKHTIVL